MLTAWAPGKKSVRSPEGARSAPPNRLAVTPAALANRLRGLTDRNVGRCRWARVSPTVQLVEYASDAGGKRLGVNGVHTCKSSMCPMCVRKWMRTRGEEISRAVEIHEAKGRVLFVTPTARHHKGMDLGLFHVLMRDAWGHMHSGRAGVAFQAALGCKPETVRAWDWTYSVEKGWHPHYHVLAFLPESEATRDERELETLFFERWVESLKTSLLRFHWLIRRVLQGEKCRHGTCSACYPPDGAERSECPHWRERARRLFGARNVPRGRLDVALRQISDRLRAFRWKSIAPSPDFSPDEQGIMRRIGLCAEWARDADHVSRYLAKMGVFGSKLAAELAGQTGKRGRMGGDGCVHYSLWEVAAIAADSSERHHYAMRSAWHDLFFARKGMHVILFSDREKLGLGPDPYGEGGEPADFDPSETTRLIAEVDGETWDANARIHKQGVIVTLESAHALGTLEDLPWLTPSTWWHGTPSTHDPPSTGPPRFNDWCAGWQSMEAEQEAERRGRDFYGGALCEKTKAAPGFAAFERERLRASLAAMGLMPSAAERAELTARLRETGQVSGGGE